MLQLVQAVIPPPREMIAPTNTIERNKVAQN